MTPAILEFRELQVRAGKQLLLDIPSFRLAAGELVALVGPNGSGKTTFLHTAALLRAAQAGEIDILGETANRKSASVLRHRISIVFQNPLLFNVTVLDNAAAGPRFRGSSRAESRSRALEWLRLFGVAHLADRQRHELSGGEAARVALARAFATEPDLLLLDEPFSALDAGSRAALIPELRVRLAERSAAAILVTHDLAEAFAFASRLALLDGGKLIADGEAGALTMRPPTRRVAALLGTENVLSGRLVSVAHGCGVVEIAPGARLTAVCSLPPPLDTVVTLSLPAAMISLFASRREVPGGWNALPTTVTAVSAQRGWELATLDASGVTLQACEAWQPAGTRWSVGDTLLAAFAPDAAWIIPSSTCR